MAAEPRAGSAAGPGEVSLPHSLHTFWPIFYTEVTDRAVYHSTVYHSTLEVKLATPFPVEERMSSDRNNLLCH